MISREAEVRLKRLASSFRSVAVIGPRQSGKTTLCRKIFSDKPYVSLENPDAIEFARSDPKGFLAQFKNGAILDEIQRMPLLFSYLQQILDETKKRGLFVLTGSNNFLLQENITQTLAGRIAYQQLLPLSLSELGTAKKLKSDYTWHIVNGGYPEVISKKINLIDWYSSYYQTYVERDVRQLKSILNLANFAKFVRLCAGRTGQLLNLSSIANDCGIDQKTAASWLSILQSSFIVYLLRPYYKNFSKRVVKSPKLYFYDTGLASSLLGITKPKDVLTHSAKGFLFENLIVTELLKQRMNAGQPDNLYFWRDKTGNEIDVLLDDGKPTVLELKAGETVANDFFKGLEYFKTLAPASVCKVVFGGPQKQKRSNNMEVLPWNEIF